MPNHAGTTGYTAQPFLPGGQRFAFAMARFQGQAFKSMLRYQMEALSFLKQRYEQDIKLVDDLTRSQDFNDAFDIYAAFLQNAVADYAAESGRVASLGSRIASDTAARVKEEASATITDMAAGTTAA